MPGVNQHYLPKFLQRRFGVDPGDKKTKVFRLATRTGACRKANPRNEAAERHYYRLVDEDGVVNDDADAFLTRLSRSRRKSSSDSSPRRTPSRRQRTS